VSQLGNCLDHLLAAASKKYIEATITMSAMAVARIAPGGQRGGLRMRRPAEDPAPLQEIVLLSAEAGPAEIGDVSEKSK